MKNMDGYGTFFIITSAKRENDMKNTLKWEFFFKQLLSGVNIDETCFYFIDDPNEEEHYIGFLPGFEKPYWTGYCDVPDGTEYYTTEELVNDRIYDRKSLKERWGEVRICSIEGVCLEEWLKHFEHITN